MLRSLDLGLGLETFAKFLRVSVSDSKNLVWEKNIGFGFGKIWSRKKSIGFGKFGLVKKSLGIGFGQNFGIVIQCSQRQKLPPTLEIITRNFSKFSMVIEFFKQFQNFESFPQNFQNHREAATDIKGAAASLLVNKCCHPGSCFILKLTNQGKSENPKK